MSPVSRLTAFAVLGALLALAQHATATDTATAATDAPAGCPVDRRCGPTCCAAHQKCGSRGWSGVVRDACVDKSKNDKIDKNDKKDRSNRKEGTTAAFALTALQALFAPKISGAEVAEEAEVAAPPGAYTESTEGELEPLGGLRLLNLLVQEAAEPQKLKLRHTADGANAEVEHKDPMAGVASPSLEMTSGNYDGVQFPGKCWLCEKVIGKASSIISKHGCGLFTRAKGAAFCEAVAGGPEDPAADACTAIFEGSCKLILKLIRKGTREPERLCDLIHLC